MSLCQWHGFDIFWSFWARSEFKWQVSLTCNWPPTNLLDTKDETLFFYLKAFLSLPFSCPVWRGRERRDPALRTAASLPLHKGTWTANAVRRKWGGAKTLCVHLWSKGFNGNTRRRGAKIASGGTREEEDWDLCNITAHSRGVELFFLFDFSQLIWTWMKMQNPFEVNKSLSTKTFLLFVSLVSFPLTSCHVTVTGS